MSAAVAAIAAAVSAALTRRLTNSARPPSQSKPMSQLRRRQLDNEIARSRAEELPASTADAATGHPDDCPPHGIARPDVLDRVFPDDEP